VALGQRVFRRVDVRGRARREQDRLRHACSATWWRGTFASSTVRSTPSTWERFGASAWPRSEFFEALARRSRRRRPQGTVAGDVSTNQVLHALAQSRLDNRQRAGRRQKIKGFDLGRPRPPWAVNLERRWGFIERILSGR
jgi:hypothetical protein